MPRVALTLLAVLALAGDAQAIVGGGVASRPYPYMAQLEVDDEFLCGASLVRAQWVLTAAHCVEDENGDTYSPARVKVVLGRVRLSDGGGEVLSVAEVRKHPDYAGNGHDVALLRLASASSGTPVRIVSLTEADRWAPGVSARVIGWGAQNSGGGPSNELREVDVTIQDDSTCASSAYALVGYEADTMLCAGEPFGGRDSCQGDSGGPLTVTDAAGGPLLAGVVSGGVGCALPLSYGVYARLGGPVLAAWLEEQLPGAAGEPPPASAPAVSVTRRLKLRGGRLRVALRSNVELRRVRVRVVRRGRLYAKGRAPLLEGRRTLRLKPRRTVRRGRYTVSVTGTDAAGTRLRLAAPARR